MWTLEELCWVICEAYDITTVELPTSVRQNLIERVVKRTIEDRNFESFQFRLKSHKIPRDPFGFLLTLDPASSDYGFLLSDIPSSHVDTALDSLWNKVLKRCFFHPNN